MKIINKYSHNYDINDTYKYHKKLTLFNTTNVAIYICYRNRFFKYDLNWPKCIIQYYNNNNNYAYIYELFIGINTYYTRIYKGIYNSRYRYCNRIFDELLFIKLNKYSIYINFIINHFIIKKNTQKDYFIGLKSIHERKQYICFDNCRALLFI